MSRLHEDRDCTACFMKGCDCTCKTCMDARERNARLTRDQLMMLNLAEAGLSFCAIRVKEPRE